MMSERAQKRYVSVLLAMACCWMVSGVAAEEGVESTLGAQGAEQESQANALAKTVQNPIASLISLPFQYNLNANVGEFERTQTTLNVQPVIPFKLGEKANLITRTIIPLTSFPVDQTGSVFGFGDINLSVLYSPRSTGRVSYGLGGQLNLPTASNEEVLGAGAWSVGPAAVFFWGKGKWTAGAIASNVWDFADAKGRTAQAKDVNFFFAQWFVNYNFGRGLALGTAPIITCDWNYDTMGGDDDRCTFPLGLQIAKVTYAGSQPMNLLAGYYTNIKHPVNGADAQARIQVNFLFPAKPKK